MQKLRLRWTSFCRDSSRSTRQTHETSNARPFISARFTHVCCHSRVSRWKGVVARPICLERICDVSRVPATDSAPRNLEMLLWLHLGRLDTSHLSRLLYPSDIRS